jgi:O-antigen/teichoic acid export membrane protein
MTGEAKRAVSGSRQVAKETLFYMIAALLPQAASMLLLPVYSRYLSPDDYGLIGLLSAFATFLPLIWTLQIGVALPRFYFEYTDERLGVFLTTITTAVVCSSLLGLSITYLLLPLLTVSFFPGVSQEQHPLFVLTLLSTFFGIVSTHFMLLLRTRRKAKVFMVLSVSVFAIGIALNLLEVVVLRRGARGMVEAGLWTALLNAIAFGTVNLGTLARALDWKMLRAPWTYTMPLIPHTLSGIVFLYSDRLILARFVPLAALGLYTFSDRVAGLFKILVYELNSAFQPHFLQSASRDRATAAQEARDLARGSVMLNCLGVSALALFSAEAVDRLLDERYFPTWKMIPLLASGWVFRSLYCFSSSGLFFEKKTGLVAVITAISAAFNIGANLCFVPRYGAWAAVFSTIAAYWISYVLADLFSRKSYRIPLDTKVNFLFVTYMYGTIGAAFYLNAAYVPKSFLSPWAYLAKAGILAAGVGLWMLTDMPAFARLARLRKNKA